MFVKTAAAITMTDRLIIIILKRLLFHFAYKQSDNRTYRLTFNYPITNYSNTDYQSTSNLFYRP
jgi:hypothetical protein